jgi:hypothetical protein
LNPGEDDDTIPEREQPATALEREVPLFRRRNNADCSDLVIVPTSRRNPS